MTAAHVRGADSALRYADLVERLDLPEALLSRTDLAALGLPRRAVDAVFRAAARKDGVIVLDGYTRPLIRVATYRAVIAESTYANDRVWPVTGASR